MEAKLTYLFDGKTETPLTNKKINFTVINDVTSKISLDKKNSKTTIFRCTNSYGAPFNGYLTIKVNGPKDEAMYEVSSNNNIISIDSWSTPNANGEMLVYYASNFNRTGTSTITIKALDGSGKSLKVKVNTINPVSDVTVSPQKGSSYYLTAGKSMKLVAKAGNEYGTVSGVKFDWECFIGAGTGRAFLSEGEA